MNKIKILILCFFYLNGISIIQAADYIVDRYGTVGDGITPDTKAIQAAIDDCSLHGGGRVLVPAGKYLSGTLELKSEVTFYLDKNAVLLGSTDLDQYRNLDPFTEGLGIEVGWALLVGVDAQNIVIEGEGTIDGQGKAIKERQISTDNRPESQRWGRRPFLLRIVRCTGVKVAGVTLKYAGAWTSNYSQSRKVQIENVKIVSVGVAHNDGIGIDGCQDVQIRNCDVVSGDDALVFKTTSAKMGCRNIRVSGMRLKSNQAGIKMGTESIAPFEDIKISDCMIYDTNNGGIKLLTVDGAHLRNIEISEIKMRNVKTPMLFRLGSRLSVFRKKQDKQQITGTFENVVVRNVKALAATNAQLKPPSGILITGVPGHDITGLTLENIEISLAGGGTLEDARHAVPEAIDKYPEVKTFGPTIPAYGLWARHVRDLKLKNIRFILDSNDLRPAIICEDAKNISVENIKLPETKGNDELIRFENVTEATLRKIKTNSASNALLKVEGTNSREIKIIGDEKQDIKNVWLSDPNVPSGAVEFVGKPNNINQKTN